MRIVQFREWLGARLCLRATAVDKVVILITLGILASPVRAELILSDAQMDNVTAGAFIVGQDPSTLLANPDILVGLQNGHQVLLLSVDNGNTYHSIPDGIAWTPQELYISTTQGYAAGLLIGPQGQSWDGGYTLPPDYVLTPDVVRGALMVFTHESGNLISDDLN